MKKLLVLLSTIATISSSYALADGMNNVGANNLYLGISSGASWNDIAYPAAAFRFDGGYKFNEYFAFEVGSTGITQAGTTPNRGMRYYDASLKMTLPMMDLFNLFAQVGGAYGTPGVDATGGTYVINPESNKAGWNFLTSMGAEINLTKEVSLNITDHYYWGGVNPQGNTNVLLGGFKFNF